MGNNNSRFRQTEHLLRHYNYYKAKIEEKRAEIAYLKQYGLPEVSPNFVGANIQGNNDKADMLEQEILRLEKLLDFLTKSVKLIELALDVLRCDPYYIIIELKYFKNKSFEYIADYYNASTTTIYRNRDRLINKAKNIIFSEDRLKTILTYKGGDNNGGRS